MVKRKAPPRCLCGGECGSPVYSRGLSATCYQSLARRVRAGETTWEKLVEAGVALEKKAVNATRKTPINRKLEKVLAQEAGSSV